MKIDSIESSHDLEILRLKDKVKIGGTFYEEKYSFWARLIPSDISSSYEVIKNKRVSELTKEEQDLLVKYLFILNFSSLQLKVDNEEISKKEYIEYLQIRSENPLDKLRDEKLTDEELRISRALLNDKNVDSRLKTMDEGSVVFRHV